MNKYLKVLCLVALLSAVLVATWAEEKAEETKVAERREDEQAVEKVAEESKKEDLKEAESGHHGGGHHGHGSEYFQYARVPHHDEYEFGYRKGNPHHFRERHEQKDGHRFRTKVRWGDKKGGYGEHFWEYNHAPKHHHHHDHHHGH